MKNGSFFRQVHLILALHRAWLRTNVRTWENIRKHAMRLVQSVYVVHASSTENNHTYSNCIVLTVEECFMYNWQNVRKVCQNIYKDVSPRFFNVGTEYRIKHEPIQTFFDIIHVKFGIRISWNLILIILDVITEHRSRFSHT